MDTPPLYPPLALRTLLRSLVPARDGRGCLLMLAALLLFAPGAVRAQADERAAGAVKAPLPSMSKPDESTAATLQVIYEQLTLILNLGAVRENEIIIFDGVPWRVKSLGFIAELVNPALDGGGIELPIRELVGHHSRGRGGKEPLFPTEKGNWVLMGDATHAKVISQTPFFVEVLYLGGSRVSIPTADFLSLHPENLSRNYRVNVPFGIDYQHQSDCTGPIPIAMQQVLEEGLSRELGPEEVLNVHVTSDPISLPDRSRTPETVAL